jgi:hypothetical protein
MSFPHGLSLVCSRVDGVAAEKVSAMGKKKFFHVLCGKVVLLIKIACWRTSIVRRLTTNRNLDLVQGSRSKKGLLLENERTPRDHLQKECCCGIDLEHCATDV